MTTRMIRPAILSTAAAALIAFSFGPAFAQEGGTRTSSRQKETEKKDAEKKDGEKKDDAKKDGDAAAGEKKEGEPAKESAAAAKAPALAFKMKDIDGKDRDLKEFHGKVVLMVNTASQCGFTPQYAALQEIQKKYEDRGFVVLAFPSNDFGNQEPGPNEEIKKFCADNFQNTFPLFAKIAVKGKEIAPLYKYLTATDLDHKFGGEIKWNFTKFLVSRKGEIIDRFNSAEKPTGKKMTEAIEKALADPAPAGVEEAPKQPMKPANKPMFRP